MEQQGTCYDDVPPDLQAYDVGVLPIDPFPEELDLLIERCEQRAAEELEWALGAAPSAEVAAAVSELDPQRLSGDQRVRLIQAWERLASWVAAGQQAALAAVVEATEDLGLPGHLARHEVGAALRLPPGPAYDRCRRAQELRGRLAETLAELSAGRTPKRHSTTR